MQVIKRELEVDSGGINYIDALLQSVDKEDVIHFTTYCRDPGNVANKTVYAGHIVRGQVHPGFDFSTVIRAYEIHLIPLDDKLDTTFSWSAKEKVHGST